MLKSIITSLLTTLLCLGAYFFLVHEEPKYVDLVKAFDEFEMNQELNQDIQKYAEEQKLKLDQTYLEDGDSTTLEIRRAYYQNQLENLKNELQLKSENNRLSVLEKINKEVEVFAKENKYQLLLGANGTGSILYAEKDKEVTNEFIEFLNSRYNDK